MSMIVGTDFDNTLVGYDDVFLEAAREAGLMGPGEPMGKRALRDALRERAGGEMSWRELQALVYGERMGRARPHDGAIECLTRLRAAEIPCFVVSHKGSHAAIGDRTVDLRGPALEWLAAHGCFSAEGPGMTRDRVFFEDTRHDKLARIAALGVTHFVDDLVETFLEPEFPAGVVKILFDPSGAEPLHGMRSFSRWDDIGRYLLDAARLETASQR